MKALKLALFGIPVSAGSYYAYTNYFQGSRAIKERLSDTNLSDSYLDFIQQKNLVTPPFYEKMKQEDNYRNFFFGGILRQLQGVDEFGVYIEKSFNDVVNGAVTVSEEEKQRIFNDAKLYCIFVPNVKVQGHEKIVHGGFTATLFDNMAGSLAFMLSDFSPMATAYLTINYRKPVRTGEEYHAEIYPTKIEGKKVYINGKIKDIKGNVYAETELLFVKVQWKNKMAELMKTISQDITESQSKETGVPQLLSPQ